MANINCNRSFCIMLLFYFIQAQGFGHFLGQYLSYIVSITAIILFFFTLRGYYLKPISDIKKKMDKKVDKDQYERDRVEHSELHKRDYEDLKHIRGRIDAIYDHFFDN